MECTVNFFLRAHQSEECPGLVELRVLKDAAVVLVEFLEGLLQDFGDLFLSEEIFWILSHHGHHLGHDCAKSIVALFLQVVHSVSEFSVTLSSCFLVNLGIRE